MSDTTTTDRTTADNPETLDQPKGKPKDGAAAPPPSSKRKLLLSLLAIGVVAAAAAYGAYYVTVGRFHQETDDAYVNGNLVQLTPQVTGTVIAVNADDTQIVKAGEPVVKLDNADAKVALANAEAVLGQTVRQVSSLYVNNDFYAASVAQRQADLARANDDLRRRVAVAETGAVSAEKIAHPTASGKTAQGPPHPTPH